MNRKIKEIGKLKIESSDEIFYLTKTEQILQNKLDIEELRNEVDGIVVGSATFETGELVEEVSIEKVSDGEVLKSKDKIEQELADLESKLNNTYLPSINQNTSDINQINSELEQIETKVINNTINILNVENKNNQQDQVINQLVNIVESGGSTIGGFKINIGEFSGTTIAKPTQNIPFNKPNVSYNDLTGEITFNSLGNTIITFSTNYAISGSFDMVDVTYELIDELDTVLDSDTLNLDFSTQNAISTGTIIIGSSINITAKTLRIRVTYSNPVIILGGTASVSLNSNTGGGNIVTTDDVINISTISGNNVTEAFNNVNTRLNNVESVNPFILNEVKIFKENKGPSFLDEYGNTWVKYETFDNFVPIISNINTDVNIGGTTSGEVKSHTHTFTLPNAESDAGTARFTQGDTTPSTQTFTTDSTGGSANLAAGVYLAFYILTVRGK